MKMMRISVSHGKFLALTMMNESQLHAHTEREEPGYQTSTPPLPHTPWQSSAREVARVEQRDEDDGIPAGLDREVGRLHLAGDTREQGESHEERVADGAGLRPHVLEHSPWAAALSVDTKIGHLGSRSTLLCFIGGGSQGLGRSRGVVSQRQ